LQKDYGNIRLPSKNPYEIYDLANVDMHDLEIIKENAI